jgi:prepilin-type N-terminal cleavage/methylation domain-containing protein
VIDRLRLDDEAGFSLSEMLVVLVILGVVLAGLTQLFVAGINTTEDQSQRFRAQQQGRLALDSLRREIHCASELTPSTISSPGVSSITITLGSYCTTGSGSVTWCTVGSGTRYALWRIPGTACNTATAGSLQKADFLTTNLVFPARTAAGGGLRAKLSIALPVDVDANRVGGLYQLQDDIVLRNSPR